MTKRNIWLLRVEDEDYQKFFLKGSLVSNKTSNKYFELNDIPISLKMYVPKEKQEKPVLPWAFLE